MKIMNWKKKYILKQEYIIIILINIFGKDIVVYLYSYVLKYVYLCKIY